MKRKTIGMKRMTTSAKSSKPKSHDDYLAAVTEDKRGALQKLRKAIKMAAPKAEECISYQLPAFRLNGKFWSLTVPRQITAPSIRVLQLKPLRTS